MTPEAQSRAVHNSSTSQIIVLKACRVRHLAVPVYKRVFPASARAAQSKSSVERLILAQ